MEEEKGFPRSRAEKTTKTRRKYDDRLVEGESYSGRIGSLEFGLKAQSKTGVNAN